MKRCCVVALGAAAVAVGVLSLCAIGQEKVGWTPAAPDLVPDEVLPDGTRRLYVAEHVVLAPHEIQGLLAAGKASQIDAATGTMVVDRIIDHLPLNWGAPGPDGVRADSYGNPIVNEVEGLPAWAQWNVDALRAELKEALERVGTPQGDALAGNYLGQAIVRGIPFDDIVHLENAAVVTDRIAAAVLDHLHFYENVKAMRAADSGYVYRPSIYGPEIERLAKAHERVLADVLSLNAPAGGLVGRAVPSGCYDGLGFTRGMATLSGETLIWNGGVSPVDDAVADVPVGFGSYFYPCDDDGVNFNVRVCTNGYISFFEQGGGAATGATFSNDNITDALDPDGFAGPFWDDLLIANPDGFPDQVGYLTVGVPGAREFTVEWFSVSHFSPVPDAYHYFQVKLFEATQNVEFHYGIVDADPETTATIGMEDYDGLDGDCGPSCLNTNTTFPGLNQRFATFRPFNDSCGFWRTLSVNGGSLQGDLVGFEVATNDGQTLCAGSGNNADLWYGFRAPCDGAFTVTTCGTHDAEGVDTGMDTVLTVFDACGGTELACNDDAGGCASDTGAIRDSSITLSLVANQNLRIRVSHFSLATPRSGDFTLNWSFVNGGAAPVSDACADAQQVLSGFSFVGTLGCATNDGTASCGSSADNRDVWYRFTAPSVGTLSATTCGSVALGMDSVLALFDGCGGSQITCNDDIGFAPGCAVFDAGVSATLAGAQSVLVRVSHFASSSAGSGAYQLNVAFCACDRDGTVGVNVFDLLHYLDDWFAGASGAELDGAAGIDVFDLLAFLDCWFPASSGAPCA